eukprot:NODE_658_length_5456_cov_0.429158.p3 type:complete len:215 gc:universal NODE_658_length_5456_cov_0.429158:1474-830(-)
MPVSQRNKVVHIGNVSKKSKESRQLLYGSAVDGIAEYKFIYILNCTNQRNQFIKELRQSVPGLWMFGKSKMIHKVFKDNNLDISRFVVGDVCVLMSNESVEEVQHKLQFSKVDYARKGMKAQKTIILEQLARSDGDALPSSMLEQLKKLNLPVKLNIGKIILEKPYTLCEEGKEMTNEQCQVSKMLWMPLAKSHVDIIAYYDGVSVVEMNGMQE